MCSNTQCKKNRLPGRLPCYRYVRIPSTTMLCSLWLALCIFFAVSSVTTAKDCRATRNVLASTESLQTNAILGGHVWNHVWGLTKQLTMDMRHQQAVGKLCLHQVEISPKLGLLLLNISQRLNSLNVERQSVQKRTAFLPQIWE